jgi:hypothetical protein
MLNWKNVSLEVFLLPVFSVLLQYFKAWTYKIILIFSWSVCISFRTCQVGLNAIGTGFIPCFYGISGIWSILYSIILDWYTVHNTGAGAFLSHSAHTYRYTVNLIGSVLTHGLVWNKMCLFAARGLPVQCYIFLYLYRYDLYNGTFIWTFTCQCCGSA